MEIDTMATSSSVKKLTKRDYYSALYDEIKASGICTETISTDDFLSFIAHEQDLLMRKASSGGAETKQQKINKGIAQEIADGMEPGKMYTVTDMIKEIPACAELTNQRVSGIIRTQMEDIYVKRIADKKKTYFQLIETEE
jgi:hypothetical protein